MLKKTVTYIDFDGSERTEDLYFNLTKAEIMEMQLSVNGGLGEMLNRIVASQDLPSLIKYFKEIILKAYGEKTPDGRGFKKSEEIRENFVCTEAYSQLFMELATNADAAAEFVNGIIPSDLQKEVQEQISQGKISIPQGVSNPVTDKQ